MELGYEVSEEDKAKAYIEVSGRKGFGVKADDLVDALVARGYVMGKDVVHLTVAGGHDQGTWGGVLPQFLVFAFR